MRIGFVTQLLWNRYGQFWRRLFEEAGAEILLPNSQEAAGYLDDRRLAAVPGLAFRLAVAQALSLDAPDLIVAPSLNSGSESQRGGGQDPWVADFPGALGTLGGLPPIMAVPAWLGKEQESLAIESLHQVTHDTGRVRRIWDRHRTALRHETLPERSWAATPAGQLAIGVVGQPWLLNDALVALVAHENLRPIGQHQVDPFRLRAEGARVDPRMIPTDQEVLGATRHFSRRGSVAELHMVIDGSSGPDLWLRDRVAKHTKKPLVVHELHALLAETGPAWLLPEHK